MKYVHTGARARARAHTHTHTHTHESLRKNNGPGIADSLPGLSTVTAFLAAHMIESKQDVMLSRQRGKEKW